MLNGSLDQLPAVFHDHFTNDLLQPLLNWPDQDTPSSLRTEDQMHTLCCGIGSGRALRCRPAAVQCRVSPRLDCRANASAFRPHRKKYLLADNARRRKEPC